MDIVIRCNTDIVGAGNTVQELGDFPVGDRKLAYAIARNIDSTQSVISVIGKAEKMLMKGLCELDGSGNIKQDKRGPVWKDPEMGFMNFAEQRQGLLDEESEIRVYPMKMEDVQNIKGVKPKHLASIAWMTDDDFQEEEEPDVGLASTKRGKNNGTAKFETTAKSK